MDNGDNTYGGKYVVNPSGGLISKGHPLGATGLAQCFELCKQLRNECDDRQVSGATIALQHNLGLGGAVVVALYKKLVPLAAAQVVTKESSFQSDAVFVEMEKKFSAEKDVLLKKINAVFRFELSGGPNGETGVWCIDAKSTGAIIRGGEAADALKADCTFKMKDADCFKLLSGKLNPQAAFLQGKLKISGNMGLAMKLQQLKLNVGSKL